MTADSFQEGNGSLSESDPMRMVITGAGGRLGSALLRAYRDKFEIVGFDHDDLDLTFEQGIRSTIAPLEFDVLVNAAAFTNVDASESKRDEAFQVNAGAPKVLAQICNDHGARFIHFSTDYVFDGEKREPYTEDDPAKPISVYGESKRAGESSVLGVNDRHLVIRVSWVFGPERPSFIDAMIKRAGAEEHIEAVADKFSTPTYTKDIAEMLPQLFAGSGTRGPGGILHFANTGACSWQEYAQFALDTCGSLGIPLKTNQVGALTLADMKQWVAQRPVYSVLSTAKYAQTTGHTPRPWRDAVADYIQSAYPLR